MAKLIGTNDEIKNNISSNQIKKIAKLKKIEKLKNWNTLKNPRNLAF